MINVQADRVVGSFRDPAGSVYLRNGRIFRTVEEVAASQYEHVRDSGALARLAERSGLIGFEEVDSSVLGPVAKVPSYVLEHPFVPYVSYPYEWCFSQLRRAALLHLDLQIAALEENAVLRDATAYNIQYFGAKPIFIDLLSLRPYREGEYWTAHSQFCEQFLNPLLLQALCGVAPNAWYRGTLEGVPIEALARLVPFWRRLSWRYFLHIALPARLQRAALRNGGVKTTARRPFPRSGYGALLIQLRNWIAGLYPARGGLSIWGDYANDNTYSSEAEQAKRRFVGEFIQAVRPEMVWDIGCNTGAYSELALECGARRIVGFDIEHAALEKAFRRAEERELDFLPLYSDMANPSPGQGWLQKERMGFADRSRPDALIALALEHHLAIGRNLPLPEVVGWLTSLASCGVIEFVEKEDPTVQRMLALREDIFPDYNAQAFEDALAAKARIVRREVLPGPGRILFWFDRDEQM